jgi:hypothetical protein
MMLDLDVTDPPVHREQEVRFFHRHYGHYYYLSLCTLAGEILLCGRAVAVEPRRQGR